MKLIQSILDRIANSTLLEQALQRKEAVQKISDLSFELADHMILIQHGPELYKNHWKDEVNAFLVKMFRLSFIKTKNGQLTKDVLESAIWDGPLGVYPDYTRKHRILVKIKSEAKFSEPTIEDYLILKKKYENIINLILNDEIPTYDLV